MYGEQIKAMNAGKPAPYTERFVFDVPDGDPGRPVSPAEALR